LDKVETVDSRSRFNAQAFLRGGEAMRGAIVQRSSKRAQRRDGAGADRFDVISTFEHDANSSSRRPCGCCCGGSSDELEIPRLEEHVALRVARTRAALVAASSSSASSRAVPAACVDAAKAQHPINVGRLVNRRELVARGLSPTRAQRKARADETSGQPLHALPGLGMSVPGSWRRALAPKRMLSMLRCPMLPNLASERLHEELGFKKVAHFERIGHKFDRWVDVGYWQYSL
jgi:hypothetical protein